MRIAAAGLTVRQSRTMASARKPVIVRKFSRDWCAGYAGADFGQQEPELEFLDLTGKVVRMGVGAGEVGLLCAGLPCRIGRPGKPGAAGTQAIFAAAAHCGAWLRLTLADGDELEGLAANDRSSRGRRGIAADPARYAIEYATDLCAPQAIQALEVLSLIGAGNRARAEAIKPERSNPGPVWRRRRNGLRRGLLKAGNIRQAPGTGAASRIRQ